MVMKPSKYVVWILIATYNVGNVVTYLFKRRKEEHESPMSMFTKII